MARRKRKDPDDAPIDGDYTKDVVLNKDPDKAYALVSIDDLPVMRGRGYVRTERSDDPNATRPAYDVGDGDGGYQVGGQLMLMEAPKERAEAIQRRSERAFAQQMTGLRDELTATHQHGPGGKYGSLGPQPGKPLPQFNVTN